MALAKTVTKILDNKTAAASASTDIADCTAIDTTDVIALAIGVQLTFNAAATLGAVLKIYAAADGVNYDAYVYDQFPIAYTSGAQAQTFVVNPAAKLLKAKITNLDTGQSITAIYIYAHDQSA